MKKLLLLPAFSLLLMTSGCSVLKNLGLIPSQLEMVMGLKEALSQGLFKWADAFADPNGNPIVRFAFPG
ncbi:MAG: DUF4197 domain-containing protein, partial [Chitinophagaceae bacterium]|nr:DUF4197 domain-containing protein [Chitinophagaceae bacterium]